MESQARRHSTSWKTAAAVAAVSIGAHVLVLLVVHVVQPIELDRSARRAAATEATARAWPASCAGDVALATAARLAYCATPLADGSCAEIATAMFRLGIDACAPPPPEDEAVAIAFFDEEQLRQLEQETLPLAELLEPETPPPPPEELAPPPEQPQVAEVAPQPQEEAQPEPPPPQPEPPPQPAPQQQAQIIETVKPESEEAPDRARFISEFDTRVQKETVARGAVQEEMVARPAPEELPVRDKIDRDPGTTKDPTPREIARQDRDSERPPSQGELAMRAPGPDVAQTPRDAVLPGRENGLDEPLGDNGLRPRKGNGDLALRARERVETPGQQGYGRDGGKPPVPSLRPSEELLARAVGGGSVDHLEGIETGDETLLNSKGWKHASFFNRMKRQVAQNWHPAETYQRRDPDGSKYGFRDRRTVVRVSLRPDGSLAEIVVIRQSGIDFLDDEAMRAFRAAQPFPNPPSALVDARSQLITFEFGFHFEVGQREPWKIIRYR